MTDQEAKRGSSAFWSRLAALKVFIYPSIYIIIQSLNSPADIKVELRRSEHPETSAQDLFETLVQLVAVITLVFGEN